MQRPGEASSAHGPWVGLRPADASLRIGRLTASMARTRSPGYADQRDEILRRAAELFARNGYTATSMNEVADACGVSKAALYHYVRDKQELLFQIAAGHVGRLEQVIADVQAQPPARGTEAAEARLRALIDRFVREYASAQDEHRVLTEDVRFLADAEREQVLAAQRRVVAAFSDAVATVRPALARNAMDKPLAMLLFGMINWMFTWLKPGGPLTHEQMAPVVADLFFGGLGAVRKPAAPRPSRARPRAATTIPSPTSTIPTT